MPYSPILHITKPTEDQAQKMNTVSTAIDGIEAAFTLAHIAGLRLEWVSATSIKIKTGAAVLPDGSGLVPVAADITKASLSLSASTWYHIYLCLNSGAADVEIVATAPTAYFGTAFQKTGDATRRYLGSLRTDVSGNVHQFLHVPAAGLVRYRANTRAAPFRVLLNGTATSAASVDCSPVVPATSRTGVLSLINTSAQNLEIGCSDSVTVPTNSSLEIGNFQLVAPVDLNSSQAFQYAYGSAPGSGAYVDVIGYYFDR